MISVWITVLISAQCALGCPYANLFKSDDPTQTAFNLFYQSSQLLDDRHLRDLEAKRVSHNPNDFAFCRPPASCQDKVKYRTYDGTCNNLQQPLMGAANQCNRRLFPNSFIDGVSQPPSRPPLSDVYKVIQATPIKEQDPTGKPTFMAAELFQFFAHDVAATALSELPNDRLDCCDIQATEPQCAMSVDVTEVEDYSGRGVACMPFLRTARCPCSDTMARQTLNTATAYIDLSHIYGPKREADPEKPWLRPLGFAGSFSLPPEDRPESESATNVCLKGDGRASQQQAISFLTIVFFRLHNKIANRLRELNPHWEDDVVFEEARRIVIARWQIFYFDGLLTTRADPDMLRRFGLHRDNFMAGTEYDPQRESGMLAEFTFAEARAHGQVPESLGSERLRWFDSAKFYSANASAYVNQLAKTFWEMPTRADYPFARSVAFELFTGPKDRAGLSMLLINVQRGRDVGLPDYATVLEYLYGAKIQSYDDIRRLNVSSEDSITKLEKVYPDVRQIDLYVGGLLEQAYNHGAMPRTFQIIKLTQHSSQVYGDRLFWSHRGVFTDAQRSALIESAGFSQMLCEALEIDEVPEDVLRIGTDMKSCDSIGQIDLKPWIADADGKDSVLASLRRRLLSSATHMMDRIVSG